MRALSVSTSSRGGGHVLDCGKFLAADEVEAAEHFAGLFARGFARFAAQAGQRTGGAVQHLDEIGDHRVFGLHGGPSWG
jgi:hypothetical protein